MASTSCITTCDERPLDETPTWAVAMVCFVLVIISLFIEQFIHHLGEWLWKKQKRPLYEALEKIKSELMLLGFISLFLTVVQDPVSKMCIPRSVGRSWHPCDINKHTDDQYLDPCRIKGKLQFASKYAIHQLHIFIFVLAVAHVLYCITTLGIGKLRMRTWRAWEDESKTIEYQFYNDPERFRFARETSFGRKHLHFWSNSPILLWIVCFFRQFYASVEKVDYLTLRHGFAMAHLAPQQEKNFDFQLYINRALEEDFTDVVGISPVLWMFAVLYFLTTTNGWYSYYWLPFIPLIIILLVGTQLQVIITKMGLRIQERGEIVKGTPLVEPGDDLFWFNRPSLLLFFIHFVLFQNAYQLVFFAWSWWKFNLPSCFHKNATDIAITLSMGALIQVLCSYVTLPLYALVTQMGSTMKPVIFGDNVASAIRTWHQIANQRAKNGRPSKNVSPVRSMAASPLRGGSSQVQQKHGQVYPPSPNPSRMRSRGNPESSSRQIFDAGSHEQSKIEITLNDFSLENKLN
ncbi:hypothetical protein H5410_016163 [Solanum commersonii]|uniref:MLO-like protein n=1 Tax=Solanum commersonii TaxID=4109 RepID=A0A9J5ZW87_SOLCO|nr:hypothetical protein H5410_016163 [Solanum commersonii]